MENNHNFKLIDGTFTTEDAETVLTRLLNYKIDFHKREDFSNHIRFNQDLEHSKKRVDELTQTKLDLKEVVEYAKENNLKFVIKSIISVELEK